MGFLCAQAYIEVVFGTIFEQHYAHESYRTQHGLQNYQSR